MADRDYTESVLPYPHLVKNRQQSVNGRQRLYRECSTIPSSGEEHRAVS